jgi:hypothetical protein
MSAGSIYARERRESELGWCPYRARVMHPAAALLACLGKQFSDMAVPLDGGEA